MKPNYNPRALQVPDNEITLDNNLVYWRGDERLTGVTGEELPNGGFEFMTFKNGFIDGSSGELSPSGDLVYEEWYCENFLHGISREFRSNGTLQVATCYEFAVEIWVVKFTHDGYTVRSTVIHKLSSSKQKILNIFRADISMPSIRDPEDAADITKH